MGRIIFLFMLSVLTICGCGVKQEDEVSAVKGVVTNNPQKENVVEKNDETDEIVEEELEEEEPPIIDVIDPNTGEIIRTIIPEELGYKKDMKSYKNELKEWARELAQGNGEKEGYDKKMVPDRLKEDGTIEKGSPRIILDESELVEKIIDASTTGGEVELPIYTFESDYDESEVLELQEAVVATYKTYFNTGVTGRAKNIELSAEAINNVIIGPGDHFSFNETVGPREKDRGYQPALEIVNGKYVEGIGGGVCQTSSTLFNAVDQVGVKYLERHHHSKDIGYVPKGRDATVSYGGLDFRFENTANVPFILKAYVNGGELTVEVRTANKYKDQL